MPLYEVSLQVQTDATMPPAMTIREVMLQAIAATDDKHVQVSDVKCERVNTDDDVSGVAVVKVAAYMAVCKLCKWKFRYNGKVEADRMAKMHMGQAHPGLVDADV